MSELQKITRTLTINYNAYKRIEKDILYYENDSKKLDLEDQTSKRKEELFSELEDVLSNCREKQEIYREKLVKLYEEHMGNTEITETEIFGKIRDLFYG